MKNPIIFFLLLIAFFSTEFWLCATKAIFDDLKQANSVNISGIEDYICKGKCKAPESGRSGLEVLMNIDNRTNPCDNFYRFACGGFLQRTIIPNDTIMMNSFTHVQEKIQEQLKMVIEEPYLSSELKSFKLVKNFYKACMNKSVIETRGFTPLLNILKQLGGWPILDGDQWNESAYEWKKSILKFRQKGYRFNHLLDIRIGVNPKNTSQQIIHVNQPSLGVPLEYLLKGINDTIVRAYFRYMVDVAIILGADRVSAEKELEQSLAFELELAKFSVSKGSMRNMRIVSTRSVENLYPSIPWKEYFIQIFPPSKQVESVLIRVPSYISDLEKLIARTDKRIQVNYVMWRAVSESVDYLNDRIIEENLAFLAVYYGKTKREPRSKKCIELVSAFLPLSVGALYIRQYFDRDSKEKADEMITDIRNQISQIFRDARWMDDETTKAALEKNEAMSRYVAYPDELLDDTKLENFYKNLNLSEDNHFENILNIRIFDMAHLSSKFRLPFNRSDWVTHGSAAVVNAHYNRYENGFELPAGILQGPFFSNDRPRYMNYGAIGTIIGHEMTHGFDDNGRKNGKKGNLKDWWSSFTNDKYIKKVQCLIHQYGNYTEPDVKLNLNGLFTLNENVADNGGTKAAYLAYRNWSARNPPELRLPGLEKYTPQQMFWISYANTWCTKSQRRHMEDSITTDWHSPSEFRVLGSLSNMPQFAEDFNCVEGSRMNPKEKCNVW